MPKKNLPEFSDSRSLRQSAQVLYSIGVLLQIGVAECASVNARVGESVFKDAEAEGLVPAFLKVSEYLKKGFDVLSARADVLDASASPSKS